MKATITRILAELDGVGSDSAPLLNLWADLYPPEAVSQACADFTDICAASVDVASPIWVSLRIGLLGPAATLPRTAAVQELLNAALIRAVQRLGAFPSA
jgi:hypothetical protein